MDGYHHLILTFFQNIPGFIWFLLKVTFLLFLFLWVRATLPRYRYDQLMRLGWKVFLPLSLAVDNNYIFCCYLFTKLDNESMKKLNKIAFVLKEFFLIEIISGLLLTLKYFLNQK